MSSASLNSHIYQLQAEHACTHHYFLPMCILMALSHSKRYVLNIRMHTASLHLHHRHQIAVLITNQVTAEPGASMFVVSAKSVGGNIMGHACDHSSLHYIRTQATSQLPLLQDEGAHQSDLFRLSRHPVISFRKGKGDQRIAKVIDSPCLPEEEAIFSIGSGGITEASD